MVTACPVALRTVDERTARLTAGVVTVAMLAVVISPFKWLALALAADFFMRGFTTTKSPLCTAAQGILRAFRVPPAPVDAGPKKFASRIGFALSLSTGLAGLLGAPVLASVLGGILVFCAFLEAAFALCLGCKMYSLLPHREAEPALARRKVA